jgi:hypothetical protein
MTPGKDTGCRFLHFRENDTRCLILLICALIGALTLPLPVFGQVATPAAPPAQAGTTSGLLKLFLDCYQCDEEYLRQNVTFVEYVRDRAVADIHVLVTVQETGGGGGAWTLNSYYLSVGVSYSFGSIFNSIVNPRFGR